MSCIPILRQLKVIFELTKAKNIGIANDFNLNEIYLVFLTTSHRIKVYDRVLHRRQTCSLRKQTIQY